MEDVRELKRRAEEHRAAGRQAADLWESVIRFNLAARYEELAARRESLVERESVNVPPPLKRAG